MTTERTYRRRRWIGWTALVAACVAVAWLSEDVLAQAQNPPARPASPSPEKKPTRARKPGGPAPDAKDPNAPDGAKEPQPADEAAKVGEPKPGTPPAQVEIPPEVQKQIDDLMAQPQPPEPAPQPPPAAQPAPQPTPGAQPAQPAQKTPEQRAAERAEERRKRLQQQQGQTGAAGQPGAMPGGAQPGARPGLPGAQPGAAADEGHGRKIEIPAVEPQGAPEARMYQFSIKDSTYDVLMEMVAAQTGLAILGEVPPDGKVSFVTDEQLTFEDLLSRVRMLLFRYKPLEPYWLLRRPTHLEVIRVNDYPRIMPADRMFRTVDEFRAASLPPEELVLVLFTPPSGSLADLNEVRNFMADYVRVTPLEGQNTVAIFALVSDVEKYLWLATKFFLPTGPSDPRKLEIIEVKFLSPSEALDKLRALMQLDGGGVAPRPTAPRPAGRPGEPSPLAAMSGPDCSVVAEDAQGVLIVRAMQEKIDEIKLLLPFIDVNTHVEYLPVVIELKHAEPETLVAAVQQMLGPAEGTAAPTPAPAGAKPKRARPSTSPAVPGTVTAADVTMIPHPVSNAIIVKGPEEAVARVRELIRLFDVESEIGPLRIQLNYADADVMAMTLTQFLSGGGPAGMPAATPGKKAMQPATIIADPAGNALWYTGGKKPLETVRMLLKEMDVQQEPVSLHVVRLINKKPSFVASMLQQYDSGVVGGAGGASQPARRGKKGAATPAAPAAPAAPSGGGSAKFTPEDEQGRLYVLCTETEWEGYKRFIQELEGEPRVREFALIHVTHITPDEALAKLNSLNFCVAGATPGKEGGKVRCETTDDSVLVLDASEVEIQEMKSLVSEFDRAVEIETRTFEIKNADPAELKAAIEALISESVASGRTPVRRPGRAGKDQPGAVPVPVPAGGGGGPALLTIVQVDNKLKVKAPPAIMAEVAAIIEEFDVKAKSRAIRVYENCPPGADIDQIAATLSQIINGTQRAATPRAPKPQAAPAAPQPAGGPEGGPQFIPQSASGKLIVIAEEADFAEIEELLALLCKEVQSEPPVVAFVPVKYAAPADVVAMIEPLLAIQVRRLIQAGEVVEAVEEVAPGKVKPAGVRVAGAAEHKPYHIAPDERNKRVVIAAPQKIVDAASALIADFDTPIDKTEKMFAVIDVKHMEPAEMVEMIDPLLSIKVQEIGPEAGEEIPDPAVGAVPGAKPQPRIPARAARDAGKRYHLAPDDRHKRIVIMAPAAVIEEARLLVAEFDKPGSGDSITKVDVIPVKYADPAELVEMVEPLLMMKVEQLVSAGEVAPAAEAAAGAAVPPAAGAVKARLQGRSTRNGGKRYHMEPDPRNKQIVIAAPQSVIDEAAKLIAKFDQPSEKTKQVFETVVLRNADPDDMVKSVKELMGAPARPVAAKGGKGPVPPTTVEPVLSSPVSIVAAPGGGAVVLQGPAADVEQAKAWVTQLDDMALPGRVIKVYEIDHVKVEYLVDLIMNTVDVAGRDTPGIPGAGRAMPPILPKSKDKEEKEEEEFKTTETRMGKDIYLRADYIERTMIVSTTSAKLAEIDKIVAQFDTKEQVEVLVETPVPRFMYELKFAKSFDAVSDLETILKAMWEPANKLPKVSSGPVGETLIVRYPDESRFDEIRDLIAKFVDKYDEEEARLKTKVISAVQGITAYQTALMLQAGNPEIEIEIVDDTPKSDAPLVERLGPPEKKGAPPSRQAAPTGPRVPPKEKANPCVLPLSLQHAARQVALTSLGQRQEDEEHPQDEGHAPAEPVEEPPPPVPQPQMDEIIRARAQELMEQARRQQEGAGTAKTDAAKPQPGDEEAKAKPREHKGAKLTIRVNNNTGAVEVTGPSGVVKDVPDWMEDVKKELENAPKPPDIRIYRVRYIDVFTAQDIVEEMFNATKSQMANVNLAIQQQQRAMQQQQRQLQQQQQGQQQQPGKPGEQPGQQGRQQPQQPQMPIPELPPTMVRIYPNPRDRSLIFRADTSQYSAIEELLAIIDQPKPIDNVHRIIPLKKLNATDVEALLKEWLGLEEIKGRTSRTPAIPGQGVPAGVTGGPGSQLPQTIVEPAKTGIGDLGVDPQDIKISSNAENNTILVMAPQRALDYIENLIKDLENQDVADRVWKTYELKHADVDEVAEYLRSRFTRTGGGGARPKKGDATKPAEIAPSLTTATIIPYAPLRLVTVQATDEQITEIDAEIEKLDLPAEEEDIRTITLVNADAAVVAETLTAMFGGTRAATAVAGRGEKGGAVGATPGVKFIGEDGGRVLFYTAPERLHERIAAVVQELEEQSAGLMTPRVIQLQYAKPSTVADAIDAAYGAGGGARRPTRGARGAPPASAGASHLNITAHDASKRLFVLADDATFAQIESLAKLLDVPQKMEGFELRIYPLQYADARAVYTTMNKLITDYMRRLPQAQAAEPFSVEVNDKANALVVLGDPAVFAFVEDALKTIDTPANAATPPGVLMTVLKTASAQEVAGNINKLWSLKTVEGETPPAAEANLALNMVVVRGTQKQLDEIKRSFIDPLESQAGAAAITETITLKHALAEDVAESVMRFFEDKKKAAVTGAGRAAPQPPQDMTVVVTPDANANQIIVQASESNLAFIKERVAQLDRPEVAGGAAMATKVYSVNADPNAVVNLIREWTKNQQSQPGGATKRIAQKDQIVAVADAGTQTVVVTASESNHVRIKEVVASLNTEGVATKPQVKTIKLVYADAFAIQEAIGKLFKGDSRNPRDTVTAVAETTSNTVAVSASPENMKRVEEMIAALDTKEALVGEEVRVVTLLYSDATEIQTAMQDFLRKPGAGGGRGASADLVGDTRVSVLPQTNAVVISGVKEKVDRLEQLARSMDAEGQQGAVPQIIQLQHARVGQILPSLQEMFVEQRGGGGGKSKVAPPVIVANETLNALVAKAGPTDLAAIRAIVERLDTPENKGQTFRIIQIAAGVSVSNLAPMIEESINEGAVKLASGGRDRQPPTISVKPDPRTNSLIVGGSPTLFEEAEQMARALEKMGPQGNTATTILKTDNIPVEDIQRLIDQLTNPAVEGDRPTRSPSSGRRSPSSAPSRPRSQPQPSRP
ncbi:MAG: hypothetical protein HY763_15620 [Planctomycetes bacterium]|nr:hypothetical protein [Planctomycetota bacterium]